MLLCGTREWPARDLISTEEHQDYIYIHQDHNDWVSQVKVTRTAWWMRGGWNAAAGLGWAEVRDRGPWCLWSFNRLPLLLRPGGNQRTISCGLDFDAQPLFPPPPSLTPYPLFPCAGHLGARDRPGELLRRLHHQDL